MALRYLFALLILSLGFTPACAGISGFRSVLFDGTSFKESQGEGALLVRDGMLPVLAGEGAPHEDPLPAGTGGLAFFCYRQSSGGKLRKLPAVSPMAGVALTVRGNGSILATRTNSKGYAILALPAGTYQLQVFNFTKRVVVEPGKTALVAMRGGKRMVD